MLGAADAHQPSSVACFGLLMHDIAVHTAEDEKHCARRRGLCASLRAAPLPDLRAGLPLPHWSLGSPLYRACARGKAMYGPILVRPHASLHFGVHNCSEPFALPVLSLKIGLLGPKYAQSRERMTRLKSAADCREEFGSETGVRSREDEDRPLLSATATHRGPHRSWSLALSHAQW